jgi:predicted ATPase/DNA-binding winged helix-turn-helix (wHTH) protein
MSDGEAFQSSGAVSFGPFRLFAEQRLLERAGTPLHVGTRALDILIILVEQASKVVSKSELLDRVWPNVAVDEGALRVHVAALRKLLGDGESGARYVATLSGRGYCFVAPVSRSAGVESPVLEAKICEQPNGLPARLGRMVGRDQTVREISSQLMAERFVTVVGPGGIGKTTVALSVGYELLAKFAGGVRFLDLGPLRDPHLVPSTIASALGLPVRSDDPTPSLVNFLRDRRMLLILDSCEHVIETAAALAERVFGAATQVYILATSREAMRVEGEHVHRLGSLESPPADVTLSAKRALEFPAVQLFVERVAASGRRFELDDADAPVVGEICRKLDGIALAIELAAGRVNACGIRETLQLLTDRFNLLREGRRTALARHQTLGATLDWSYDLMPERERLILRRLSVFAGTFTLDAARMVVPGADIDGSKVVTAVASLVEKSLVAVNRDDTAIRYRLLDTTRAYAAGKLAEEGGVEDINRRHAEYYCALIERNNATLRSAPDIKGSPSQIELLDNARAALEWAFSERGDVRIGVALATASARLFLGVSLLTECHRWSEQAIAVLDQSDRATACEVELQAALGIALMFTRGNGDQALASLLRALALAEDIGDQENQLRLLEKLHIFYQRSGDCRNGFLVAQRSESVAESLGDLASIGIAHWSLGFSNYFAGNHLRAEEHWSYPLLRPKPLRAGATGAGISRDTLARSRCGLAAVRWLRGFADQAADISKETIEPGPSVDDPATLCICLIFSGFMFLRIGDLAEVQRIADRLIAHAEKYSFAPYQAIGVGMKGALSIKRSEAVEGIHMVRTALETLRADRYELHNPAFLSALAEGLMVAGQPEEAGVAIDEAISLVELNEQLVFLPEFLRLKGEIEFRLRADGRRAEALFLRSLQLAGRQSALAWELRAATSLARLRSSQGRTAEARSVLAAVYHRFTEGFETSDLKAAKCLLDRLDGDRSSQVGR